MIRKALKNRYVVAIIAVAAIVVVGLQLRQAMTKWPLPSRSSATKTAAAKKPAPAPAPAAFQEPRIDVSGVEWGTQLDRNPFQPSRPLLETAGISPTEAPPIEPAPVESAPEPEPETLPELQAVWIQGDRRLAILNRRVIAEGEAVGGWNVKSIQPDRVIVAGSRQEREVPFQRPAR
jgi:hypothetical protein